MANNLAGPKNAQTRTFLSIAAIAGFGVLIAVGAAIYLLLLRQPSGDDYREAARDVQSVKDGYADIVAAARASADQTRQTSKLQGDEALTNAITEYEQRVEKLADSNVTLDNDVERAMDAFEEDAMKQPQLIEGRTHVVNASVLCEPMFVSGRGKVYTSLNEAAKSKLLSIQCIEAVKPLESSSIADFKKFGSDLKNNANNRIEFLERYYGAYAIFSSDKEKIKSIEKELQDIANVIKIPDFEKLSKEYDSDASFRSLDEAITTKSRGN